MEAGEGQEIVWNYRWEVHPAPRGLAAWLVDDGGRIEPTQPAFFAFLVREASARVPATISRFASGGRRSDQLRFADPPPHFIDVISGDHSLGEQEIFVFLPASAKTAARMPWFRIGQHVFFEEQEARSIGYERREAAGTAVSVARAGQGLGSAGPDFDPEGGGFDEGPS